MSIFENPASFAYLLKVEGVIAAPIGNAADTVNNMEIVSSSGSNDRLSRIEVE